MKSFEEFEEIYRRLNDDKSHYLTTNDVCTPLGCVKEIMDTIPYSFWKRENTKILDASCGNGNFHAYTSQKVPLSHLYFNDTNPTRLGNVRAIFGEKAQTSNRNFLTMLEIPTYDMIVSNPPYAVFLNGRRSSKNLNLSRPFIEKALHMLKPEGYLIFLVPDNWMSFSDRNLLPRKLSRYQFIHLNIHGAKKWFKSIGIAFTWFVLQKVPNRKPVTIENFYGMKNVCRATIPETSRFIPLHFSNLVRDIVAKTIESSLPKYETKISCFLHRTGKAKYLSKTPHPEYPHKVFHTPTKTLHSKLPHPLQGKWKVLLNMTNKYQVFISQDGITQSCGYILCDSYGEAKRITEELSSSLYVFLNNITRYGNFNNVRALQHFPKKHYVQLSNEETAFIKRFNKMFQS